MNKEILKTTLIEKKVELNKELKILEILSSIDLSKFKGKKITNRISLYVQKELSILTNEFIFYVSIYNNNIRPKLYINASDRKKIYQGYIIQIDLQSFDKASAGCKQFDIDTYERDIDIQSIMYKGYIEDIEHDLKNIDFIVEEHKKLIYAITKFNRDTLKSNFVNNINYTIKEV